jgi:hypothetical protein
MSPSSGVVEERPLSESARLTGVVIEPKRAFADIAARPRFWVPLALILAIAVGFTFAMSRRVGWENVMRTAIEKSPRVQNLSVEQREQIIQQQTRFMNIAGYPIAVVAPLCMILAASGIYLLIFRTFMGTDLTFKQMLAIYCYSGIPGIISSLLALLVMYLKPPEDFDVTNPLAFNLGAFLPEGTAPFLVSLGTSIDLFMLWALALMAVGVYMATRRTLSPTAAAAGVFGPWLLWVLGKSLWAAKFG